MSNFYKRQKINEVRYQQEHGTSDAATGKRVGMFKLLQYMCSKDMREPLFPMLSSTLAAHVSGCEFQYPDLTWKELCGLMSTLVAESGGNKGQLSLLVEAICRAFREHDATELEKLIAWQKLMKSKGANKEKPPRPDVACRSHQPGLPPKCHGL